ncbi:MAG: TnpV protein [Lachnospiraceae bacterium]|nr:TnpV protein [Lachnospiraceae bacterium]
MELTYTRNGDYLIPNLTTSQEPEEMLTKYGLLRKCFLKEHRRGMYTGMMLQGTLIAHCLTIQQQAEERMDFLTEQMAEMQGVNEALKAYDQMKWVRMQNNIRASAEEIVLSELIIN